MFLDFQTKLRFMLFIIGLSEKSFIGVRGHIWLLGPPSFTGGNSEWQIEKKKKSLHNSLRHECFCDTIKERLYSVQLTFDLYRADLYNTSCYRVNYTRKSPVKRLLFDHLKRWACTKKKIIWQNQTFSRSLWATPACSDCWPPGGSTSTSLQVITWIN